MNTFTVLTAEGFSLPSSEKRRAPVSLNEILLIVRGLVKSHKDRGEEGGDQARCAHAQKIKFTLRAPPPTPAPSLICKGCAPTPMEAIRRALERGRELVKRHREGGATRRARRVLARSGKL